MDNKGKRITCTSMEKTNSRQFIIVIKVILTISVVHFPNELNQNAHSIPTGRAIKNLSKFSPTKATTFSRLIETQLLKFSQNIQSLSLSLSLPKFLCVTSIYTQPIRSYLKQTNLNLLSKQYNLYLKLSHSVGGLCLLCKQTNVKLRSVIQLLATIVQFSSYLKYTTFGLLCKQTHLALSHICT